jgi:hypothetical protein
MQRIDDVAGREGDWCTVLSGQRRGGWSLVRADSGDAEGWFPSSFLRTHRTVAVVDTDLVRIREARRRLGSASPPRAARPVPDATDSAKSPAGAAALLPTGRAGRGTPGAGKSRGGGGGGGDSEVSGTAVESTPGKARPPPSTPASGRKYGGPLPPPPSMPPPSTDKRCRRPIERLSPRWEKGEEPAMPALRDEAELAVVAGHPVAEASRAGPGRKRAYGAAAGKSKDEEEVAACAIPCTVGRRAAWREWGGIGQSVQGPCSALRVRSSTYCSASCLRIAKEKRPG